MKKKFSLLVLSLMLFLTSCSGGGGGGGTVVTITPVTLTSGNADDILVGILTDLDEFLSLILVELETIDGLADPAVYVPYTCVGGTGLTSQGIDVGVGDLVDAGDTFTATFTLCEDTVTGAIINGMFVIQITGRATGPLAYTGVATFTNYFQGTGANPAGASLNGTVSFTYLPIDNVFRLNSSSDLTISFTQLSGASGSVISSVDEQYQLDTFEWFILGDSSLSLLLEGTLDSEADNGRVTFATEDRVTGADAPITRGALDTFPVSGSFVIRGAESAAYGIEANGADSLLQEFDSDGDGLIGPALAPVPAPTWTGIYAATQELF